MSKADEHGCAPQHVDTLASSTWTHPSPLSTIPTPVWTTPAPSLCFNSDALRLVVVQLRQHSIFARIVPQLLQSRGR